MEDGSGGAGSVEGWGACGAWGFGLANEVGAVNGGAVVAAGGVVGVAVEGGALGACEGGGAVAGDGEAVGLVEVQTAGWFQGEDLAGGVESGCAEGDEAASGVDEAVGAEVLGQGAVHGLVEGELQGGGLGVVAEALEAGVDLESGVTAERSRTRVMLWREKGSREPRFQESCWPFRTGARVEEATWMPGARVVVSWTASSGSSYWL